MARHPPSPIRVATDAGATQPQAASRVGAQRLGADRWASMPRHRAHRAHRSSSRRTPCARSLREHTWLRLTRRS
jgi:hypothetical protein